MNKLRFGTYLMGAVAVAAGLSSCADESPWGSSSGEKGSISLTLTTDFDFDTARPSVRNDESTRSSASLESIEGITLPELKDFSIKLEKEDGSQTYTWTSYNDFTSEAAKNEYPVGTYTLTAYYGTAGEQGINKPYFEGKTTFNILAGHTREINLTAELMNSMVQIEYSEQFKEYMKEYSASISTEGSTTEIVMPQEGAGIAFIEPGNASINVSFTTDVTNKKVENLKVGEFAAIAKTLHKVTLNVNPNPNGATLEVTFDETVQDGKDVSIDLTKDLYTKPAPTITATGFTNGETINMLGDAANDVKLLMNVVASYGIKSAILKIEGTNGYSYNNTIELVSSHTQSDIVSSGFPTSVQTFNDGEEPKKTLATLDLTQMAKNLCKSETVKEYTISLKVSDYNDKESDPMIVTINSEDLSMQRIAPTDTSVSEVEFGSTTATLNLAYNGPKPEDVIFLDNNGNELPVVKVTYNNETVYSRAYETKVYEYTLELPSATTSNTIGITAKDRNGKELGNFPNIPVGAPKYEISKVDAYTTYAYLQLKVTLPDGSAATEGSVALKAVTNNARLANGSTSGADLSVYDASKGILKVTGLTPGTNTANISLSLSNWGTASNVSTNFSTETATGVPNGDFEDLYETINTTDNPINQGGKWTQANSKLAERYQTTLSMVIKEPKGWISSNPITSNLKATNINSWYVTPSVYNTTLTWLSYQPEAKVGPTGQSAHTTTADVYKNFASYKNSNAIVIRNVAWDLNGETIGEIQQTGDTKFSNYYCSNEPTIANRTRGYLKLGTDGNGESFSSRPTKLKGFYMYKDSQDSSESGLITVKLLNGSTEIGSGSIKLSGKDDYTSFDIPIKYNKTIFGPKATKLQIEIYSSDKTSDIKTKNYCNKDECCSRGAALYVDDLTFEY